MSDKFDVNEEGTFLAIELFDKYNIVCRNFNSKNLKLFFPLMTDLCLLYSKK